MTRDALNICMYTPSAAGGHALYTQELLTAIADLGRGRGVAAELVTCEDLAAANRSTRYPIHTVLPRIVPKREFPNLVAWASSRLMYYSRRERAFLGWLAGRRDLDVIHFQEYTPWLAPTHYRAFRRRGLALVFTVHNVQIHYSNNSIYRIVRDTSLRTAWRECDALLVHSDGLRDALSDFLGPGHPPIHVTPHGVWNGQAAAAPAGEDTSAESWTRLLFFGVLRPNKGVEVLLRAMERLPHCHLTVAGAAEDKGYHNLVRQVARGLPPGRVELIDHYIDDGEVDALFTRSRVVVLPYTFFAAQSGVLHQALAHGLPVVATDVGALGECVSRWGIGEVVPSGDERALAAGIERVLEPDRYRAAADAIVRVRDELTWARMAEATIDVYRAIVA